MCSDSGTVVFTCGSGGTQRPRARSGRSRYGVLVTSSANVFGTRPVVYTIKDVASGMVGETPSPGLPRGQASNARGPLATRAGWQIGARSRSRQGYRHGTSCVEGGLWRSGILQARGAALRVCNGGRAAAAWPKRLGPLLRRPLALAPNGTLPLAARRSSRKSPVSCAAATASAWSLVDFAAVRPGRGHRFFFVKQLHCPLYAEKTRFGPKVAARPVRN